MKSYPTSYQANLMRFFLSVRTRYWHYSTEIPYQYLNAFMGKSWKRWLFFWNFQKKSDLFQLFAVKTLRYRNEIFVTLSVQVYLTDEENRIEIAGRKVGYFFIFPSASRPDFGHFGWSYSNAVKRGIGKILTVIHSLNLDLAFKKNRIKFEPREVGHFIIFP